VFLLLLPPLGRNRRELRCDVHGATRYTLCQRYRRRVLIYNTNNICDPFAATSCLLWRAGLLRRAHFDGFAGRAFSASRDWTAGRITLLPGCCVSFPPRLALRLATNASCVKLRREPMLLHRVPALGPTNSKKMKARQRLLQLCAPACVCMRRVHIYVDCMAWISKVATRATTVATVNHSCRTCRDART
jgi:hypothetical protein